MMTTAKVPNAPQSQKHTTQSAGKPFSLVEYLKGVKAEWFKIVWPSRIQVISQTAVVLVMVTLMTLGLWLADRLLYDGFLCHVIPNGQERCYEK